jgi:hypothetical protein
MRRDDLKQRIHDTGHSVADLCRALDQPYNRISGGLLGYWHLPVDTERAIDATLAGWERERQVAAAVEQQGRAA